MNEQDRLNDYDSEPVKYCASCYSIKIGYEESVDSEYCMDCGCFDLKEAPVEEWEKLYEKKYGHKFAEKSNDPRKSPIFKLSLDKLKMKLYDHPLWKNLIKALYPGFPGGLGKADSIILFFDKLVKDNKINDFRFLMLKHLKDKPTQR